MRLASLVAATEAITALADLLSLQDRTYIREEMRRHFNSEHLDSALKLVQRYEDEIIHPGLLTIAKRPQSQLQLMYYSLENRLYHLTVSILETLARATSADQCVVRNLDARVPQSLQQVQLGGSPLDPTLTIPEFFFEETIDYVMSLSETGTTWPINLNRAYFAFLHPLFGQTNKVGKAGHAARIFLAAIPSIKSMLSGDSTSTSAHCSAANVEQFISVPLSEEVRSEERRREDRTLHI